jgi:hypothetical protein
MQCMVKVADYTFTEYRVDLLLVFSFEW